MKTREVVLNSPGTFVTRDFDRGELKPGTARVAIRRIGICGTDIHAFHGRQPFFEYPRVLGHELAAEIIEIEGETDLKRGDLVAVEPYLNRASSDASRRGLSNCCDELQVLGVHCDGGMRPELVLPLDKLHRSSGASPDQLALVEMLCIGHHAVKRSRLTRDDRVAVFGAGPIGMSVLTFATLECDTVGTVDLSDARARFAEECFDVQFRLVPDETGICEKSLRDILGGELPTVIFDATGSRRSMETTFAMAAQGARIVFVGLRQGEIAFDDPNFHRRELSLLASRNATPHDFSSVIANIESGRVSTDPWITHRLDLAEVPDRFESVVTDETLRKGVIHLD
ncbi:MAG: zinc-binding alcohol dehydrogenase family protein [Verrucomicrobiota bacterium]